MTTTAVSVPENEEGDPVAGGELPDELEEFPFPPDAKIVSTSDEPPISAHFDSAEDHEILAGTYEELFDAVGYTVVWRNELAGMGTQMEFAGPTGPGLLMLVGTPSGISGVIILALGKPTG